MTNRTTVLKSFFAISLLAVTTLSNAFSPFHDGSDERDSMRRIPCEIYDTHGCREFPPHRDFCDYWGSDRCKFPKPWIVYR